MREAIIERRQTSLRWSAVFAGTAISVGIWLLLQIFGLGIGLTSIEIDESGVVRGSGLGTSVWSFVAPLLAIFIGGLFAARLATTRDRGNGAIHGLVVWALTAVAGLLTTASLVVMLASGAATVGNTAVNAIGQTTQGEPAAAGGPAAMLGIDVREVMTPLNDRLRERNQPELSNGQLEAMIRELARAAPHGQIDRNAVASQITERTQLSSQDAQDVANQVATRWNRVSHNVGQLAKTAGSAAVQAADAVGKALLWIGLSLLLSLIAGALGGVAGVGSSAPPRESRPVSTEGPPGGTLTVG